MTPEHGPQRTALVLTISDEAGKQIRRLDLDKSSGLRRIAWNLRGEPPGAIARTAPGAWWPSDWRALASRWSKRCCPTNAIGSKRP